MVALRGAEWHLHSIHQRTEVHKRKQKGKIQNQAAMCVGAKMWTQTSGTRSARACFTKCQCVREVAVTVERTQYGRKP